MNNEKPKGPIPEFIDRIHCIDEKLQSTDEAMLARVATSTPPKATLAEPWATLDLEPYRRKCLADETRNVIRAVVEHHAPWSVSSLQLVHSHVGENIFCVRCAAMILQRQRDSRLIQRVGLKFGLAAQSNAGSVAIDCGDVTVELTIIDRDRAFVRTTRIKSDGPRFYVCRFLTPKFEEVGIADVPANGLTQVRIVPAISADAIGFIELFEQEDED